MTMTGVHLAHGLDGACEMIRAAVFQVVARHGRNDDMLELHPPHRFGHALRFVFLQGERLRGADRAKAARARATIARDHDRGCALAPAFPAVRALRALADRVQAQIRNERLGGEENRIRRQPHFDPGRLLRLVQSRVNFRAGHGTSLRSLSVKV